MHLPFLFQSLERCTKKKKDNPWEPDMTCSDEHHYILTKIGYVKPLEENYKYELTFKGLWASYQYNEYANTVHRNQLIQLSLDFRTAVKFWDEKTGRQKVY
jgi:hypothetical protein